MPMLTSNSTDNFTANNLTWTAFSIFNTVIPVCALLTNLSVIYLFIRNPALRTPFTIYLISLLTANALCSIFYYPLEVLNDIYPTWWAGSTVCTIYSYTLWLSESAMYNSHGLIALNRLWAVTFPVAYRQHHKKSVAVTVCLSMWAYLHIWLVPGLVLDALLYRLPEETNGCLINTDAEPLRVYWAIQEVIVYVAPHLIVLLVYPVICYQTFKLNRTKVRPSGSSGNRGDSSVSENENTSRKFLCCRWRKTRKEHGFLVLTLMTLTILFLYTPNDLWFALLVLCDINITELFLPATVLFALNAVIDPLWFVLALPDIRAAFRRTYLWR